MTGLGFHGSMVALVTPMFDDGSVDFDNLKKLVDFHIDNGTNAIVAVGTTGESATLEPNEHITVVEAVVRHAAGRIPVIAGTGANSTSEAIHLTAAAKEVGADAALLVTPYYNKPTQEGLFQHYSAVAAAVDIPQILYNVPGRTAVDMSNDTAERLASVSNIVAIKDATGDVERGKDLIARCAGKMDVLSGDDPTAYQLILAGGAGNISVTANVVPRAMADLCAAAAAGDAELCQQINAKIGHLHSDLFIESNPIPVKWAVHAMGYGAAGIRLPLTPLSPELRDGLITSLKTAGIEIK